MNVRKPNKSLAALQRSITRRYFRKMNALFVNRHVDINVPLTKASFIAARSALMAAKQRVAVSVNKVVFFI